MKNIPIILILILSMVQCKQKNNPDKPVEGELLFTGPLGVAPFTFRNSFPNGIPETLDTIVSMGFTSIEGGGGGMDPYEYRKLCDAKGLSIPSIGGGYQALVENPLSIVEKARVYGAQYAVCFWIPHETDTFKIEDAKKAVNDFNTFGKVLADNGITFCYHPHGYEFQPYENGTLLDYLIQNTNPAYVSFEMDIFWIQFGGGNPADLLEKYGNRWKLMHIKDMKQGIKKDLSGGTDHEYNVAAGTGQLDMKRIMEVAQKVGIKHYFIEDESSRIITQIPKSIEYLRSLRKD